MKSASKTAASPKGFGLFRCASQKRKRIDRGTDAPFSGTAVWSVNQTQTSYINTNFGRGLALAKWLQNLGATPTFGHVTLSSMTHNFNNVVAPSLLWLSLGAPPTGAFTVPLQYTFYAPVGAAWTNLCGRVLYNSYIVEAAANNTGLTFPSECTGGVITPQEHLVEFALFELGDCVNSSMQFTSVANGTNQVILSGQRAPSYAAAIQVSSNVSGGFTNFGTATSDTNGNFRYTDSTSSPQKLYRGTYP